MSVENAAEVLIVGAGPTGLSLAITLRRYGIPVRIIDRNAQPTSVSKALALWSASLEALQGMGVVDRFVAEGQRLNALCVGEGDRRLATLAVGEGIDSAFPFPLLLPQSRTEALLTERLAELGVAIERNVELVGLAQDASGVTATLRHADGHDETVRTKYLAGCDGARSAVRQALDITFEGYTEPQTFLLADVKIDGGDLDHRSIYLWWHNGGTVAMFPFGKEVWRIFSMRGEDSPKGDEPATLEEMQHCVDRYGPRGLRIHDPSWLSIFRINERLVTQVPRRALLPGRRRRAHPFAGRRAGHEHRHPGCGQSRLEARLCPERRRQHRGAARQLRGRAAADRPRRDRRRRRRSSISPSGRASSPAWSGTWPCRSSATFRRCIASCRSNCRKPNSSIATAPWSRWPAASAAASARRWGRGRAKPRSSMRRAARMPACGPISRRRATAC